MPQRDPHLAAYDITEPRRLSAALKLTRAYATGGQKSVHELFLTPAERWTLIENMSALIDQDTDRFFLLRLDPRSRIHTLGKAITTANAANAANAHYFYVG